MDIGIQFEFLLKPRISKPSDQRFGEWPPAPDRVFQALVSAGAETGQDFFILSCLESAPAIQAAPGKTWAAPDRYVPENFRRGKQYHVGALRHSPIIIPENPIVTYVWRNIAEDAVKQVKGIVEQVTYIGRAKSIVRGTVVPADSVNIDYEPDKQGDCYIRTPYPGRLDDLEAAFQAGRRSLPAPETKYRKVSEKVVLTEWGDLIALRPNRTLDIHETSKWTDLMRKAVLSIGGDELPGLIHGHKCHRHLAWAAIPDVGHSHAKGHILGLGCWLPKEITEKERLMVVDLMTQVTNVKGIKMEFDHQRLKGLQTRTWSAKSRFWTTVTPAALDRWPKKDSPENIIREHISQRGLPAPVNVICSSYSPVTGAAIAHFKKYACRRGSRYICHVQIEWKNPVEGPLLIGAERYFGGGLCRPQFKRRSI
ncbi:MAG: type I-U CRISPR-associated protein Cas5/Cas6 [Desulfobacteraceae bacterium]|nr:type I-U CRISPR-associated protein Cas5/Cas6 [Desulfobacteraceae bacterium]